MDALTHLRRAGLDVTLLAGGRLSVGPQTLLTADLCGFIAKHKAELVTVLGASDAPPAPPLPAPPTSPPSRQRRWLTTFRSPPTSSLGLVAYIPMRILVGGYVTTAKSFARPAIPARH